MQLLHPMPGDVEAEVRRRLGDNDVRIAVESDVRPDGRFGVTWLAASAGRAVVVVPGDDGAAPETVRDVELAGLKHARLDPLVGSARVMLEWDDRAESLVTVSATLSERFGEVAWALERLATDGEFTSTLDEPKVRCPRCGRMLAKKDGACPACFDRRKVLGRILAYLRPYRGLVVAIAGVALVGIGVALIQPQIARFLVDDVLRIDEARTPSSRIILLLALVGAMVGVRLAQLVTEIVLHILMPRLALRATADIRAELFRRLEFLPLTFFDQRPVGAIMSRMTHDCERLQDFLAEGAPFLLNNVLMTVCILAVLSVMDPVLAMLVLLPVPLLIVGGAMMWRRLRGLMHRWWQRWSWFSSFLNESISGVRLVKAFAQEDRQIDDFDRVNRSLMQTGIQSETAWGKLMPWMGFVMSAGSFIVWGVGGARIIHGAGTMTLGKLIAFLGYLGLLYGPLRWFSQVYQWMTRALSGAERVFDMMDMTPERFERDGAVKLQPIRGVIRFDDVTFGYDRSKPVLHELTFAVEPGEMIGLVGKSGVGKSTLIKLLCRFYEADRGAILIDDVPIGDLDLRTLRQQIGIVPQEPFFFDGTIAENIAFGTPDATLEQIMDAARSGNAHGFICRKPDGYDSRVGERGGQLSAGEKQRLAIARAILRNPRILILDEATSAVDSETEKQIQEALQRLVRDRTTFAIAHRLSTLRDADRLIVLEEGRIKEIGTHSELMDKEDGLFRRLVDIQQQTSAIIEVGS